MSMNKTIRRAADPHEQQLETYRYWQSLPIGDRLTAVWDASEVAYAFAAAFKGLQFNDGRAPERSITRVQRMRS
jgi:hypothetical protein